MSEPTPISIMDKPHIRLRRATDIPLGSLVVVPRDGSNGDPKTDLGFRATALFSDGPTTDGVVRLAAGFKIQAITLLSAYAVIEEAFRIEPDITRAEFRLPCVGDYIVRDGTAAIAVGLPGSEWVGLMGFDMAIAEFRSRWEPMIAMPWRLIVGRDTQLFDSSKTEAAWA
jgi:hypothetical protein